MGQCQNHAYVYTISCPITNNIVYVGISCRPQERWNKHYRNADNQGLRNFMDDLKSKGLKPICKIIDEGDFVGLNHAERQYIDLFKSEGHKLFNEICGRKSQVYSV